MAIKMREMMPVEVLRPIVDEAHALGLKVTGHLRAMRAATRPRPASTVSSTPAGIVQSTIDPWLRDRPRHARGDRHLRQVRRRAQGVLADLAAARRGVGRRPGAPRRGADPDDVRLVADGVRPRSSSSAPRTPRSPRIRRSRTCPRRRGRSGGRRSSTTSPTPTISPSCTSATTSSGTSCGRTPSSAGGCSAGSDTYLSVPGSEPAARAAVPRRRRIHAARGDPHGDARQRRVHGRRPTTSDRSSRASSPTWSCSTPIRWRRSRTSPAWRRCTGAASRSTSAAHRSCRRRRPGDGPAAVGRAPPARVRLPIHQTAFEQPAVGASGCC